MFSKRLGFRLYTQNILINSVKNICRKIQAKFPRLCPGSHNQGVSLKGGYKGENATSLYKIGTHHSKLIPHMLSMNQMCWRGSEVRAGFWIHGFVSVGLSTARVNPLSSVCVTFPDSLPALSAFPGASPPLCHDLSLYSSRAASAEHAALLGETVSTHKHTLSLVILHRQTLALSHSASVYKWKFTPNTTKICYN